MEDKVVQEFVLNSVFLMKFSSLRYYGQ